MDLFCNAHETTRRYGRYVNDLRRLFVFHGLNCDAAESFGTLAAKLVDVSAFRTDVSAFLRSVRDMERGEISADEMLTVMALACGGEALVEGRAASVGLSKTIGPLRMWLSGMGGWREPAGIGSEREAPWNPGSSLLQASGNGGPAPRRDERGPLAQVRTEKSGQDILSTRDRGATREIEPTQDLEATRAHLESEMAGLKLHLDAIDRRIGQLEPRVEDITQIVQTSGELFQRQHPDPYGDSHPNLGSPENREAAQGQPASRSETSTAPVRPSRTDAEGMIARGMEVAAAEGSAARSLPAREPFRVSGEQISPTSEAAHGAQENPPSPSAPSPSVPSPADPAVAAPAMVVPQKELTPEPPPGMTSSAQRLAALKSLLRPENAAPDPEPAPGLEQEPALITKGPSGENVKERLGGALGVAAVLLLMLGILGLGASLLSPHGGEAAKGTPSKQIVPPNVAQEAAAPVRALPPAPPSSDAPAAAPSLTNGSAQRADLGEGLPSHPSRTSGQEPPKAEPTAATKTPAAKVAGKRSEMARKEPRIEEPQNSAKTNREIANGANTPITPSRDMRTARPAPTARTDGDASGTDSAPARGGPLFVPQSTMKRNLISARDPVYPPEALQLHTDGAVVLNAFIAKDGTVRRMDVVGGPDIFIKSAMAAVSWRRYRPYLVQGKPVEVQTQITVNYPPR